MWWLALAACELVQMPGVGTISTLCDGCFTSTETGFTTSTSPTDTPGAVFLAELAEDEPDVLSLEAWPGQHSEGVGRRLVVVGDLDGDGLRDVWTTGFGGAILRSGDEPGVRFGSLLADPTPVGDVDGDAAPDLALAGPAQRATVLPGAWLAAGGAFEEGDGWPLEGAFAYGGPAPDVDLDGLADTSWIERDADSGETLVRLIPGARAEDGLRRREAVVTIPVAGDVIDAGRAFDLGDLDGDGVGELGVARWQGSPYRADLELLVFGGAGLALGDAAVLGSLTLSGIDRPVVQVERLGDLDEDGLEDLAVAVFSTTSSVGAIVSGGLLRGTVPLDLAGPPIEALNASGGLDAADVDGDGLAELLVFDGHGHGEVYRGAVLAAGAGGPSWSFDGLGLSAALAGLDRSGNLRVWVGDPRTELVR